MTTDKDNVKIEINIAGELIILSVPFDEQVNVRKSERSINALYKEWRRQFPKKSHSELMAMICYRFASYFRNLSDQYEELSRQLDETSSMLDSLLSPSDSESARLRRI